MKKIILTTVFCFTTAGFLAAQIKLPDIAPSAKAPDYSFIVYPNLTREIFTEAWRETALNPTCEFQGVKFEAYNLLQPAKLIENLQQRKKREEAH